MPVIKKDEKPSEVARVKRATFDHLLKKTKVEREITFNLKDDAGEDYEVSMLLRAIGSKAYDDLLAKHPPTTKQKIKNAFYNDDTFPPALIAACAVEPELDYEQAKSLWDSEEWSRGELNTIFGACVEINNQGLNVPFTASV